jgi:hypothetical protein
VQDRKHRSQECDDSALRCESRPDGIFGKDNRASSTSTNPRDLDQQANEQVALTLQAVPSLLIQKAQGCFNRLKSRRLHVNPTCDLNDCTHEGIDLRATAGFKIL